MAAAKKYSVRIIAVTHPAPLPEDPKYPDIPHAFLLPKLSLRGDLTTTGIALSWDADLFNLANVVSTELYYYMEDYRPPHVSLWKKKVDVHKMNLPARAHITLARGKRYHFAVRAVDSSGRFGPFSNPVSAELGKTKN